MTGHPFHAIICSTRFPWIDLECRKADPLRPRLSCFSGWLLRISVAIALVLPCLSCTRLPGAENRYAPGQTVDLDGWRVTVHGLLVLPPDEWRQAAPGHVFCAVEVTLENLSGQIRFFMPEKQMTLLDEDGKSYTLDQSAGVVAARTHGWTVPDGEMSVGESAHGAASYQIPLDAGELRWLFRSSLFPWAPNLTFVLGEVPQ